MLRGLQHPSNVVQSKSERQLSGEEGRGRGKEEGKGQNKDERETLRVGDD